MTPSTRPDKNILEPPASTDPLKRITDNIRDDVSLTLAEGVPPYLKEAIAQMDASTLNELIRFAKERQEELKAELEVEKSDESSRKLSILWGELEPLLNDQNCVSRPVRSPMNSEFAASVAESDFLNVDESLMIRLSSSAQFVRSGWAAMPPIEHPQLIKYVKVLAPDGKKMEMELWFDQSGKLGGVRLSKMHKHF